MEVEVRVELEDIEEVRGKLEDMGASFDKVKSQEDLYYREEGKERAPQGPGSFILRIRKEDGKNEFSLKGLTETDGSWEEYETEVSDPEELHKILKRIGFTNVFTIHKDRTLGEFKDFSLCLDKVDELGTFLEVELISKEPSEAKEKIKDLLQDLDIDEEQFEHRGYARIISERMGVEFEDTLN